MANRAWGTLAEMRSTLFMGDVEDDVLQARVRSKIGRLVRQPRSVEVSAAGGRVCLRGPVMEHEFGRLVRAVQNVPGVSSVENYLQIVAYPPNESRFDEGPEGSLERVRGRRRSRGETGPTLEEMG
jgi:hypothetical protein